MVINMNENLTENYWNNRYQNNTTGWDIGEPSTPLKEYINQLQNKSIAILIPGCGNAYEAAYLLKNGFTNITLVDISELVVTELKDRFSNYLNTEIKILHANFFELKNMQFDLIIEQTFFCAILPSLRQQCVQQYANLLNPKGKVVGLLFNKEFETNPPFGGNTEEYQQYFSTHFTIKKMELCYNSIVSRKDSELFFIVEKK